MYILYIVDDDDYHYESFNSLKDAENAAKRCCPSKKVEIYVRVETVLKNGNIHKES